VGSLGTAAAFSFYPSKNLGAFGDGGAVVTSEAAIAERVRMLRNYGERRKYEHVMLAYNRRLDALQAAVLSVKLPWLDRWNADRRRAAVAYRRALAGARVALPPDAPPGNDHAWYMFVIRSPRRDAIAAALAAAGIETGIHYPHAIHRLPLFADLEEGPGSYPEAEALAAEALSLPFFPGITEEEIERVAAAVAEAA
jgi:dTDP-4-amino-4,6-dideoxygalactose transaminase